MFDLFKAALVVFGAYFSFKFLLGLFLFLIGFAYYSWVRIWDNIKFKRRLAERTEKRKGEG